MISGMGGRVILCCFSSQQIRPRAQGSFCKMFSPHSPSSFVMLQSPLLGSPQPLETLLSSKPLSSSGLNLSQTWGLIHVLHCDDYAFPPSAKLHPFLEEGRTSSLTISTIQTCITHTQGGKTLCSFLFTPQEDPLQTAGWIL